MSTQIKEQLVKYTDHKRRSKVITLLMLKLDGWDRNSNRFRFILKYTDSLGLQHSFIVVIMYLFREDLPILIVGCAVFCAIFIIGVFLQVKMIAALKHDQAIAWEINLAHSVLMIAIFSSSSILEIINYIQPSLYDNLGKWYCYLILPVILFGFFEMLFHSLYVSIYKYIFIVHSETVTRIGKQTIKRILLWTYFIILVSWTVSLAIRENFGSKKVFQNGVSCGVFHAFGTSNMEADGSIIRHLFSCSIDDLEQNKLENIIVNILTKVLCTSQSIINIIIGLNVLEIFFYLRIFRHMNRYVNFLDSNICRILTGGTKQTMIVISH